MNTSLAANFYYLPQKTNLVKTISKEPVATDVSKKEPQVEQDFCKEAEQEVEKKIYYCDLSGVPI